MSNRDIIKRILKEETKKGFWSTETKGFKNLDKRHLRVAEKILRQRHKEIIEYNRKKFKTETGYPEDFDEFIEVFKKGFPKYDFFHQINVIITKGDVEKLLLPQSFVIKILSEFILNHNNEGEQQRVDVVPKDELWDYVKDQYFDCSDDFFEHIWDEVLTGRRNYWNEGIKERMWEEIVGEVEERMEDEEWQEENAAEFDSLSQEEDYFMSYWHYPLQSLGWDKWQLCDWYRYYITEEDMMKYFFGVGVESDHWAKFSFGNEGMFYVINRNKLFW
jgi:hypothetical protein